MDLSSPFSLFSSSIFGSAHSSATFISQFFSPFLPGCDLFHLQLLASLSDYSSSSFDLQDSPLLYNPVHKKIPVLVHAGKPIAESMVILEYIEETWPENPLLPKDPYEKSVARFWAKFAEEKSISIWLMFRTAGDEQQKAFKDTLEFLKTVEDHALGDKKFFGGDAIGFVDLAFVGVAHWLGVFEVLVGVKLFDAHKFPRLHAWTENFKEAPIIKENLPDFDEMLVYFKRRRELILASQSN